MSTTQPPTDPWANTDHDPTAWHDSIDEQRPRLRNAPSDATPRTSIDHDTA